MSAIQNRPFLSSKYSNQLYCRRISPCCTYYHGNHGLIEKISYTILDTDKRIYYVLSSVYYIWSILIILTDWLVYVGGRGDTGRQLEQFYISSDYLLLNLLCLSVYNDDVKRKPPSAVPHVNIMIIPGQPGVCVGSDSDTHWYSTSQKTWQTQYCHHKASYLSK